MNTARRSVVAAAFAAIVALGCGPKVQMLSGASPGIGSSSYLTAQSPSMKIQVVPTPGHQPSPAALDLLMARANERCDKPGGIRLVVADEVPSLGKPGTGAHRWTYSELIGFEQANAQVDSTPSEAVLTIFYLDGIYGPNESAIAISYTGHSIALFKDMISPNGPEGAALVHELGHQLGLVNGTSRQLSVHEDPVHPLHDSNMGCVMFFSLDPRGDSVAPTDYCAKCKADLKAAGGK